MEIFSNTGERLLQKPKCSSNIACFGANNRIPSSSTKFDSRHVCYRYVRGHGMGISVGMCVRMCVGMHVGRCMDMCVGMCAGRCMNSGQAWVPTCLYACQLIEKVYVDGSMLSIDDTETHQRSIYNINVLFIASTICLHVPSGPCTCPYTRIHTCLYTCLHPCLHECPYTCLHIYLHTCPYTCRHPCLLHTCTYTCLRTCPSKGMFAQRLFVCCIMVYI